MTGKRFWYDFEDCNGPKIIDFKKDKEYPLETIGDFRGIEELLNSLDDENEQLKKEIGNLEHTKEFCAECCERLEKENEQLKSEIRKVQRDYAQLWMHKYK